MTGAAGETGVGPMVSVAVEQHFPPDQRIIDDNLAYSILPFTMRAVVWLTRPTIVRDWLIRVLEKPAPGVWGGVMCRKRYIDEKVIESADRIEAVVNLGAGFDTRAYRLESLAGIPVWEVDLPVNIETKRVRLRHLFGQVPENVNLVPIDLDREAPDGVLAKQGYSADTCTFFIWEAVSQYLTEAGIKTTFDFLARAAVGSRLVFTYLRRDFLEGRVMYGQQDLYKKYVIRQRLWLFGMDPEGVQPILEACGWRIVQHPDYAELADRYVKPTGRALASTPIERVVYAKKV